MWCHKSLKYSVSKVTLRSVLNGTDEEANGVLPEEGTPNVAMWQCGNTHFHLQGRIRVRQC